jgi:hypothetical protein
MDVDGAEAQVSPFFDLAASLFKLHAVALKPGRQRAIDFVDLCA